MKITLTALTLVTLTAFATGCDPEPAAASGVPTFRDGEIVSPPTTPIGGTIKSGGGHDNPYDIIVRGFDRAPYEVQIAFYAEVEQQLTAYFTAQFLADEHVYEECPWACDELGLTWDEGVNVQGLRYVHDAVVIAEDASGLYWETNVEGTAQVGCGCE